MNAEIIEHGVISRLPHSIFGYHGWGSVDRLDDGTLAAVCSGHRIDHLCTFGKNLMWTSRDNGGTWSAPRIVNDTALDDRDCGIVNLGGGRLLLTWFSLGPERYRSLYLPILEKRVAPFELAMIRDHIGALEARETPDREGSFTRLSRDNGETWSDARYSPVNAPHGPIKLSDGSLFYIGKDFGDVRAGRIVSAISGDDGATWRITGGPALGYGLGWENLHEPHAVELPDGRILCVIRSEEAHTQNADIRPFTMFQCFTADRGKTYTKLQYMDVSGSPPHLIRHSSGAVINVYGRREPPYGEYAMVSLDGGATWRKDLLIRDAFNDDLGYPASVELADGSIFTMYYQQYAEGEKTSLLYTRWRLAA